MANYSAWLLFICATLMSCPNSEAVTEIRARNEEHCPVCMEKIREQIQKEVDASVNYLVMGFHFNRDSVNRPGFAKFFFESASEERKHAMKLLEYLNMRGDAMDAFYHNVSVKRLEWNNGVEALQDALTMEKTVTESIKSIALFCLDEKEEHLADYLISDFLTEQLEGQRVLAGYINRFNKLGEHSQGQLKEYLFDQMLQKQGSAHSSA